MHMKQTALQHAPDKRHTQLLIKRCMKQQDVSEDTREDASIEEGT